MSHRKEAAALLLTTLAFVSDGGVRFQGEIALPDGRRLLDEISRDGGEHWATAFDAEYRREQSAPSAATCDKKGR